MSRFYISPGSVSGNRIVVRGRQRHHAVDVMRLSEGSEIVVFDGTGNEYRGVIEAITSEEIQAVLVASRRVAVTQKPAVTLAQAIPRREKMNTIVVKGTELGVDEILPFVCDRSVVTFTRERATKKVQRWKAIAVEASKQCGRAALPAVHRPVTFREVCDRMAGYSLAVIPCLADDSVVLKKVLDTAAQPSSVLMCIGPEGGFTPGEIALAVERGAVPVSLGPWILKCDTAACTTLSIIRHHYLSG